MDNNYEKELSLEELAASVGHYEERSVLEELEELTSLWTDYVSACENLGYYEPVMTREEFLYGIK